MTTIGSPIRAVLFDKDGTLFDFASTWMPAYRAVAGRVAGGDAALARRLLELAGLDPATDRPGPHSILAAGTAAEIASLWGPVVGIADVAGLARDFDAFFRSHGELHAQPVTDLPALFDRLRLRGLKLGLATMDSHAGATAHLAAHDLEARVDFVCGYDTGHGVKPGPGMVEAFCRAVALPAAAIAVVGDTPHDMDMARAAGAGLAIGVLTGAGARESLLALADHLIGSVAELEAVLDRLSARAAVGSGA